MCAAAIPSAAARHAARSLIACAAAYGARRLPPGTCRAKRSTMPALVVVTNVAGLPVKGIGLTLHRGAGRLGSPRPRQLGSRRRPALEHPGASGGLIEKEGRRAWPAGADPPPSQPLDRAWADNTGLRLDLAPLLAAEPSVPFTLSAGWLALSLRAEGNASSTKDPAQASGYERFLRCRPIRSTASAGVALLAALLEEPPDIADRTRLSRVGDTPGIRHIAFAVEDIDAVVAGLRARGAELVGELERYEDSYRLCYVRGPEGVIIELAEQIG